MDTSAHSLVNGSDEPTMEERLQAARERYMGAVQESIDDVLQDFLLPGDRLALVHDAAQFLCFYLVVKGVEVTTLAGAGLDRLALLNFWRRMHKQIEREVPATLLQFAKDHEAEQRRQQPGRPA